MWFNRKRRTQEYDERHSVARTFTRVPSDTARMQFSVSIFVLSEFLRTEQLV